ncbi:MAG: hypothetical protein L6Q33_02650 [Bacteriovoracaceae bacterium]|nr:hypothetical protein [Bacteriovoracaceae bacterium]
MQKQLTMLEKVACKENIERAFYACLRGKRGKFSPQSAFVKLDHLVEVLHVNILKGENYPWGKYKEFYVSDPKRRLISSAPFIDRVVHRAIYDVLAPELDMFLINNSFACRVGLGNGRAVIKLHEIIKGKDFYYAVKLDVRKYFSSISHGRLLGKINAVLSDHSLIGLIKGLLVSHPVNKNGVGLPLGNLTSQIFSNFYLKDIDCYLMKKTNGNYVRYMDDFIFITSTKDEALSILKEVLKIGKNEKLKFPKGKIVWIKNCGIPFLGFLVTREDIRPLNRNKRRHDSKIRTKEKNGYLMSEVAMSKQSYLAWENYPKGSTR